MKRGKYDREKYKEVFVIDKHFFDKILVFGAIIFTKV